MPTLGSPYRAPIKEMLHFHSHWSSNSFIHSFIHSHLMESPVKELSHETRGEKKVTIHGAQSGQKAYVQ